MAYEYSVMYAALVAYSIYWLYRRFFPNDGTMASSQVPEIEKELYNLRKENEALKLKLEAAQDLGKENEELKRLLEAAVQEQTPGVRADEEIDGREHSEIEALRIELETAKKELEKSRNISAERESGDVEQETRRLLADCDSYRRRADELEKTNAQLNVKVAKLEDDLNEIIRGKNSVEAKRIIILEEELKKKKKELKEEMRKRDECLRMGNKFAEAKIKELEKERAKLMEVAQNNRKFMESHTKKADEKTREAHEHYLKLIDKINADFAAEMKNVKARHGAELLKGENEVKRVQLKIQELREEYAAKFEKMEASIIRGIAWIDSSLGGNGNSDGHFQSILQTTREELYGLLKEVQQRDG